MATSSAYINNFGQLMSADYPDAVIVHYSALRWEYPTGGLEALAASMSEYDSELVDFHVYGSNTLYGCFEPSAPCLVIWPGDDTREELLAALKRRAGREQPPVTLRPDEVGGNRQDVRVAIELLRSALETLEGTQAVRRVGRKNEG